MLVGVDATLSRWARRPSDVIECTVVSGGIWLGVRVVGIASLSFGGIGVHWSRVWFQPLFDQGVVGLNVDVRERPVLRKLWRRGVGGFAEAMGTSTYVHVIRSSRVQV